MRLSLISAMVGWSILAAGVLPAAAQRRAPATGMWGGGVSIGVASPTDPSLDNGFEIAGNLEYYATPRISIRGQLGGSSWDIVGRHFTGTVDPLFFDGNLVYNWEGGKWHPHVTGGIGAYRYRSHERGTADGSDAVVGVDVGAGIEYFYTRRSTVTAEGLYHGVGSFNTPLTTFNKGSFWSITGGLKHYF